MNAPFVEVIDQETLLIDHGAHDIADRHDPDETIVLDDG